MTNDVVQDLRKHSSSVKLVNVTKRFQSHDGKGEMTAVNSVNIEVEDGQLMTLLGPSGCGKTTTLRMVSGFETPTSGSIFIGDKDVANLPPNKRDIGMVFQSYALFPHMTVWDNVAYGLKIKHVDKAELKRRTDNVIDLMELRGMETRYPNQLSGGQQQRVALARAVICEPRVLLFDEPLSNLDAKLREHMRDELRAIQKKLGITSIYVTHDQSEAMAISDKVLIMKDGNIMQYGTPREIYEYPNCRFVADFIGKANFIPCVLKRLDGTAAVVEADGRELHIDNPGEMTGISAGDECALTVRPESIALTEAGGDLEGVVDQAIYYGARIEYFVSIPNAQLTVEIYDPQFTHQFQPGERVSVALKNSCVRVLK